MRAGSSFASLATHVGLVVAAVWATAEAHPRAPQSPVEWFAIPPSTPMDGDDPPAPRAPVLGGEVAIPTIPLPTIEGGVVDVQRFTIDPRDSFGANIAGSASGVGDAVDVTLVEEPPLLLAGPIPAYPDLLRQAGVQGRVVLEAVVDTAGHVEPRSVVVVASAHPGFAAPAQQALLRSLFRPARMRGAAVRVRVRLAIDFVLRDGRLRG